METSELYFKTAFAVMSCDGDIANEELKLLSDFACQSLLFNGVDTENRLKEYVERINNDGVRFLDQYLDELGSSELTESEQIRLADLAIKFIFADNVVQYSEIVFFKKIRSRLTISDQRLVEEIPDSEEFLLPDLEEPRLVQWDFHFDAANMKIFNQ